MHSRPFLVTAAVALTSVALLAAAITLGWLGPDVGRGANFCEAARDGLLKQPANTLSNAGFVVAGLLVAWHARTRTPGQVMSTSLATSYACVVVLLGPASAAMHATQSAWGGHLDMLSMYLVAGFAASYAWVRWARRGSRAFAVAYLACLLACELAGLWSEPIPVFLYAGNVAFGSLLVAAVVLETALWLRAETQRSIGFGFAALGALLVAFTIWVLSQNGWCDPHSLVQGHAAWHLLCAVAAYFLARLYASERRV
ncbi:hypothetical protein EXE58_15395 [Nocardioides seonyuensis]|uniref:Ceramidase n=1 Tax=Nocardioides seonyuensis TaxID=2518371 RepID=A0A4P7IHB3_9ACTN|nr:ceramidase domain-containing protein [Nocardioides seonyuensis]QBX56706.1 hypothetical protein EXE58_15395 [Nocardioides seonyuensis]